MAENSIRLQLRYDNLINLQTMLSLYPKQAKRAIFYSLNDMAKDIRNQSIMQKNSKMTIRNRGLARKSITYKRAELKSSINMMYSQIGSSAIGNRFTGFGEQEGVIVNRRKRFPTKHGRKTKRAIIPNNLRANQPMKVLDNYIGRKNIRTHRNAIAYLNRMHGRSNHNAIGLFRTNKDFDYNGQTLKKGIHRFGKGSAGKYNTTFGKVRPSANYTKYKLETIQVEPDMPTQKLQPKENHWLRRTTETYFRSPKPQEVVRNNLNKQVEFIRRTAR